MRRIALAVVFSILFATHTAYANDGVASAEKIADAATSLAKNAPASDAKDESAPPLKLVTPPASFPTGRLALSSLYAGFAALQVYDVYSTNKAINAGALEANPAMRGLVQKPLLFIGLKAGITAGSIYQAERLWRSHHRAGAIALMAGANGIMMAVAAHNATVLNQPAIR
jgi:Domain of unknown function (DUF5658)